MVKSILDNSIIYSESKLIDTDDKGFDSPTYSYEFDDIKIIIAIGAKRFTYVNKNIIYVPAYLVYDGQIVSQIGVFEFMSSELPNIVDADNDLDIDKMNPLLFYEYATPEYLGEYTDENKQEKEEERQERIDEEDKDDEQQDNWLQEFMNNSKYNIKDNEGMGDCLFATIRDAYEYVGKDLSISAQRKILSDNVTNDIYDAYKVMYTSSLISLEEAKQEVQNLSNEYQQCRVDLKDEKDRQRQKDIVEHAKELQRKHTRLEKEVEDTTDLLHEYKFMQDVDDIAAFKDVLQSCKFWGDTWAISTLEMALNVKLVLFSSEQYYAGNRNNILTCGQINDELPSNFVFSPDYYILLEYTGQHYKLITYDRDGIFTFSDLPEPVKIMIVNTCMSGDAGLYSYIKDFKNFARKLKKDTSLYEDEVVFQFYSKSNDKLKPGKGTGEKIPAGRESEFSSLAIIPQWRRKLSNAWEAPFVLDGHNWGTVEHYYQGSKFKKENPDFYIQFSLDSNSELSKNIDMAKAAGEKSGKFKGKQIRPKSTTIDLDFFEERGPKELNEALYAKFSQNKDLGKLLNLTEQAKLQHYVRGSPAVVAVELMEIRRQLQKNN